MSMIAVSTRILVGFDDPTFGPERWERLLENSGSDNIYLTYPYQRTWWESEHDGELLLIVARRDGQDIALAPFFVRHGMALFLGTGFESGYLDFVGDVSAPGV